MLIADEDVDGGFSHGGWHSRYFDDVSMARVIDSVTGAGAYRSIPSCWAAANACSAKPPPPAR